MEYEARKTLSHLKEQSNKLAILVKGNKLQIKKQAISLAYNTNSNVFIYRLKIP